MKTQQTLIAAALASAFVSPSAIAAVIKGKIIDAKQQPVSNAKIHFHGKSNAVFSDINGNFTLDIDSDSQLHISKNNYLDARLDVENKEQFVTVTLKASAVESIVVFASALHKNNMEMASPVTVISGDELKTKAKPTLGETLKGQPGIDASYFGPVSSSPIIRGLDGPRVKITQNGLDSSDASRVGPDHANTNDSLSATQIEVLRGPATLLYGSGAIGGVVNVVDNRIPQDVIETANGGFDFSHDTVSNTDTYAILGETSTKRFNFHFDALSRQGKDYSTPNYELHEEHDEHEDEEAEEILNKVENTFIDSQQFNFGTSYIDDHLTVGFSVGKVDTDYGIPGHSHEHGHDHDHELDENETDSHEEESVFARVDQTRWQGLANYAFHNSWLEALQVRAGYTDYQHSEIEDGTIGTTFTNKTYELRTNLEHRIDNWHGALGYHFAKSDYAANGEEAFTPATKTTNHAVYLLEERKYENITLELGGRIEKYQLTSDISLSDHHHDHAHDDTHTDEVAQVLGYTLDITNVSASIGGIYQYTDGHNVAINLSRSERAPLTAELLSNGVHIATGTYELGLGYEIEDGEVHFEPENISQEIANNLDISFRRFEGNFGYTLNFFYNDIQNYYYQRETDYIFDAEHGIELNEHGHDDAMKVFKFENNDAKLYGAELDAHYRFDSQNRIKLFADSLTAKLDSGDYLPRIPNNKIGLNYEYTGFGATFNLTGTHYLTQNNIASYESKTLSYTLIDASIQYNFAALNSDFVAYLNMDNLTDELGFVHSSFIKDKAPLPGRNIKLGIRGYF
ncbi:Zinc-regulated outer membrane receptor [Pseudoalteromonas luteoviolacea B = ATCC 29581]|nr:Zinc-regulated outer membrane receptor [Pseudoalteromonas luteoviolacea B = ATCC 29581]